ncbi:MAG: hypothetical protein QF437_29735 [Planctomycetota bacterium]|jgi:pyruvate carboxylase|nr:hypothetical protein [Planctomycetota bacterium]MDP7134714.1 hypothetical protein [Planctomycetota bacterium]MDP7253109.1 hypothetical protein [Planctomycetota bacterium]
MSTPTRTITDRFTRKFWAVALAAAIGIPVVTQARPSWTSYKKGIKQSQQTGKPMMIYFTANW